MMTKKRSSDMTTPAKEGYSGMTTPAMKTSNERRMSAKESSTEGGSNWMLTPAKRFNERATPAKEKSSVTAVSAEEGFCSLTALAEEGSRWMTPQAK